MLSFYADTQKIVVRAADHADHTIDPSTAAVTLAAIHLFPRITDIDRMTVHRLPSTTPGHRRDRAFGRESHDMCCSLWKEPSRCPPHAFRRGSGNTRVIQMSDVVRIVLPGNAHLGEKILAVDPFEALNRRVNLNFHRAGDIRVPLGVLIPNKNPDTVHRALLCFVRFFQRFYRRRLDGRNLRIDPPEHHRFVHRFIRRMINMRRPVMAIDAVHAPLLASCQLPFGQRRVG